MARLSMRGAIQLLVAAIAILSTASAARIQQPFTVTTSGGEVRVQTAPAQAVPAASAPAASGLAEGKSPEVPLPAADEMTPTVEHSPPITAPVQTVDDRRSHIELTALARLDIRAAPRSEPRASTTNDLAEEPAEPPAGMEDMGPAAAQSSDAPAQAAAAAPITVMRSADGRIVIQSTDAAALDMIV